MALVSFLGAQMTLSDPCPRADRDRGRGSRHDDGSRHLRELRPGGGGVRVWQITSRAGGHPGGDRRRSVLMLPTRFGVFEPNYSVWLLFTRALESRRSLPCRRPLEPSYLPWQYW